MSGRSGFRKTDRKVVNRTRPEDRPEIKVSFILPAWLLVSESHRAHGVTIVRGGLVQVIGRSADHAFSLAARFLQDVAKDRVPFTRTATVTSSKRASWADTYEIAVTGGNVVVARTNLTPLIFEAR